MYYCFFVSGVGSGIYVQIMERIGVYYSLFILNFIYVFDILISFVFVIGKDIILFF